METTAVDRWPPVYDFGELAAQIAELSASGALWSEFYQVGPALSGFCQGDVVTLDSGLPYIDKAGEPAVIDSEALWLIAGNTCDLTRDQGEVPFTQAFPVWDLGAADRLGVDELAKYRSYSGYRQFYLPPWPGSSPNVRLADFLRPVTIHRQGLQRHGRVTARLTFKSWALLHGCLVRFLARDDGRGDET